MTRLQRSHVILGNGKLQDKHRSTLFSRAPTGGFRTSDSAVIDLVSDSENSSENNNEKDFHSNKPRVLLWKGRNEQQFDARQGWRTAPVRKPLDFVEVNGIIFRPGMSVELANNGIARIAEISEDAYGNICFKGRHLANLKDLPTLFPRWDQELCWITKVKSDGSVEDKGIPITLVRNIVRVHFTNDPWSRFGSKQQPNTYFCRLRWMCIEDSTELYVRYLDADEADEGYRVPPSVLRRHWRGETRLFGSSGSDGNRKYTFGDGFCGAGGISCGARMAGLDVKWSFDHNEAATRTYRMNFPDTICELADFDQFMTNLAEDIRVDISHSSPPCQTWSPAHTVASADDDRNSALIFSSYNLIQKVRPRIHTLEQTSGLPERYKEEYYWVVRDTLELGYSVHAKVVRADEYGVPQRRKRLIFIAAGPGERLPQFPEPTHGPGRRPYVTIYSAISGIPADAPDHDIQGAAFPPGFEKSPFDANTLAKTITCGGGENYHPSGLRRYTNRELASLQTFPVTYQFASNMKKQVGNAVPPKLAEALYRAIIGSLRQTDAEELRMARQDQERNVIVLN